ncbi:RcpC/CpaB family pilus assembly protein [Streptomyces sp. NPDC088794]|uniref:RcpC/CpaB family pilus assembly protein n=1 Tax=Streptomyces sp. NPDC088794 TaxID=3365902 RepID=UPI0037F69489
MKIQERTGAGAGRSAVPAQAGVGDRLPTPPRERKPALAALAVLLILVGALGATMLVLQAGDRIEVVKVTKEIQAGESVKDSDVTSVMVAKDDSINYVEWSQLGGLRGYKAKSTIYPGTVVMGQMFTKGTGLPAGKAAVGVALKEGQYPSDIKPGDTVAVYNVDTSSSSGDKTGSSTSTSSGGLIVDNAKVNTKAEDNDSTVTTGNLSLTLLVDQDDAAAVTRAASAGSVAIVHVPGN